MLRIAQTLTNIAFKGNWRLLFQGPSLHNLLGKKADGLPHNDSETESADQPDGALSRWTTFPVN